MQGGRRIVSVCKLLKICPLQIVFPSVAGTELDRTTDFSNNCPLLIYNVKLNVSKARPSEERNGRACSDANEPLNNDWLRVVSKRVPHAVAGRMS